MKTTNKYNIKSKSVIDALTRDDYDNKNRPQNVFSCTELIDAPKAQALRRRHDTEIEADVSDSFWTLDGSAVHYALERSNKNKGRERLSEERIYIEVEKSNGTRKWAAYTLAVGQKITEASWYKPAAFYITVRFDNYEYDEETIEDYKRCSVWEAIFGLKKSREQQLNIGAYGLRLLGFPVKKLRACLFLKDCNARERADAKRRDTFYPEIDYKEFEPPVWDDNTIQEYIINRLKVHYQAIEAADDNIPECSPEERWYRGGKVAVMKDGRKSAMRVFAESERKLADACLESLKKEDAKNAGKYRIEERPGNDTRCNPLDPNKNYCPARKFCHYWKNVYSVRNVPIEDMEE